MSLCQASHNIGMSREHINAGIPFRSRVSILIDGDVPNWPVSVQYFSHVEMAMLFLFDFHWQVLEAPCGCFPDSANKHFPWLPLTPHVRISCAPTAMFMHHLSLEHSPFLKYGALSKDRGKERCPNHAALGRAENSTHHTSTRNIERLIEGWRPYLERTTSKFCVFFLCSLEWWEHWMLQTLSLARITCHKTCLMFCLWFYNYLLLQFSFYFLSAPRVERYSFPVDFWLQCKLLINLVHSTSVLKFI